MHFFFLKSSQSFNKGKSLLLGIFNNNDAHSSSLTMVLKILLQDISTLCILGTPKDLRVGTIHPCIPVHIAVPWIIWYLYAVWPPRALVVIKNWVMCEVPWCNEWPEVELGGEMLIIQSWPFYCPPC